MQTTTRTTMIIIRIRGSSFPGLHSNHAISVGLPS